LSDDFKTLNQELKEIAYKKGADIKVFDSILKIGRVEFV
jgi:hypothetical protein